MNERNTPPYATKVVDLKPRGGDRVAHSQFGNFVPDEELIQSTARIKNQRDLIMDRLEKMNSSSDRVSRTVFDKVRRDYSLQLETISELLVEKKQSLKEEIKKLYISREKLSFEVNRHREILEEAEFRHFLGEFTQSQYQEVENFETKEIEKLEADLAHISQWVRTHEDLFDPEDFGQKRPEKKPVPSFPESRTQETVTSAQPLPQATAPTSAKAVETPPQVPATPAVPQPAQRAAEPALPPMQKSAPEPAFDAQKTEKTLVPASEDRSEEISEHGIDEFSYLFETEPEPAPQDEVDFNGTESNIKELLAAAASAPIEQAKSAPKMPEQPAPEEPLPAPVAEPKPAAPLPKLEATAIDTPAVNPEPAAEEDLFIPEPEDEDYFKRDKLDESSLNVAKPQDEDSVTASKESISAAPVPPPAGDAARQALRPDPQKPVNRDESISNILDSIRLDDEVEAKPAEAASVATQGAEASEGEFKLILTQGDLDEKIFPVRENTSIGRSPSNDVMLKEPKVSRQHAAINKYNEHYIIIDLKSSNGVYVNGVKVDECVLHLGDEISIGGYKFQFQQA